MILKKRFLLLFVLICSMPLFALSNKAMYISVSEIAAKNEPSFWSRDGATFKYGEKVEVIGSKGSWVNIISTKNNKKGWVKDSVITSKKLKSSGSVSVDAKELALAGKGFSSGLEVEDNKDNKNILNYSDVKTDKYSEKLLEKIETKTYTNSELLDFIKEGCLRDGE